MEYSEQQQQRQPLQHQGQPVQGHTRFPSDDTIVSFSNFNTTYQYPSEYYSQNDGHKGVPVTEETVEDVPLHLEAPPCAPQPPRTPSNRWSLGEPMSEKSQGQASSSMLSSLGRFTKAKNIKWRKTGTWTFEIVSLLFAVAAVASIIAILAYYDGKPLPSWPYEITLNALIAVLTTVANAAMAVPLSSGLGQLKWERFKTGYEPLTDMEVLDDASRGALGALTLLRKMRGG